jgi:AraC family transcriptional regulator of adaptative response/methylated-DNA-[protein]-cysteine methyltransferase
MPSDYQRIATAIRYIEENFERQPGLDEVAAALGLSPFHFQRLFTRFAGISPKRFLQSVTVDHAKRLLAESRSVLDAAYESGLSGPGRLHDLFVAVEAVTPGEFKARGEDLAVRYGFDQTPFGEAMIAVTDRGVCGLSFVVDGDRDACIAALRRHWPHAALTRDNGTAREWVARIFDRDAGAPGKPPVPLHVRGTNFQIKVWRALLEIPDGYVGTYEDIARIVCTPAAARAVGQAVGANPIAYLIPCHRVIRKDGAIGGYHWDPARKCVMLGWEAARRELRAAGSGAVGA